MENEEKFTPLSCLFMWISLIGLYIVSGIITYSVMRPEGFIQGVLWIITWQLAGAVIDILFAMTVMWIADNVYDNERT